MRVHSIHARNYRPFSLLQEIRLGPMATIVGKNDSGKSSILRALQVFFESGTKMEATDVHDGAKPDDEVVIEVAFDCPPEKIVIEEDVETTLADELLLDSNGLLRIRKIYNRNDTGKYNIVLVAQDFSEDLFAGLVNVKEKELNERCKSVGIDVTKSGRGITNKSKRQTLRSKARDGRIQLSVRELPISPKEDLWRCILAILPEFVLFESDTRLGVGETTFQSQFRPIVKAAADQPNVAAAKGVFTAAIGQALQSEVDEIFNRLRSHTETLIGLTAKPEFSWDKAVAFQILGKDQYGVDKPLDRRGSGMRRLLMVAFFQYMAERGHRDGSNFVFAVEEPENCLHPGLQRELVASFRKLSEKGHQVIITSHSPVFAGASPVEDLALVVRTAGVAKAIQSPDLKLPDVADELGVEPSDQITGYRACVFVEGPNDIEFWKTVASKLKEAKHIDTDFDDKNIGLILCGGESLKHWITLKAMNKLNRRFAVVVDSDRKGQNHNIPQKKINWRLQCEAQGGLFFILRKREIENYIHPNAISRSKRQLSPYDDFTDMKVVFGDNVYKLIRDMSCDEILERDVYIENGVEHHELKEIVQTLLGLPDTK